MLAVHLDLTGKTVLVVGGGTVGRRKAGTLLQAGARVRLVALESPEPESPPELTWITEPVRREHLAGMALVVTAANPTVDAQVAAWAREMGIWVNAASAPEAGDLTFAATVQRGRLLLSAGTQGAAPALAARLLRQWAETLPESLATWLDLLEEARLLARELITDPGQRQALARALAEIDGPAWLATESRKAVRHQLRERVLAAARSLPVSQTGPITPPLFPEPSQ